jgi:hypothetical protein
VRVYFACVCFVFACMHSFVSPTPDACNAGTTIKIVCKMDKHNPALQAYKVSIVRLIETN